MTDTSNLGRWAPWYSSLPADALPEAYGVSDTYRIAAQWLAGAGLPIVDWGCGKGWFKAVAALTTPGTVVRGVDGTASPFADVVADLATWPGSSNPHSVHMRGVIEHNRSWRMVLENASRQFVGRMVLTLFTPMQEQTRELSWVEEIGVPDIGFALQDILDVIGKRKSKINVTWFTLPSPNTGYGEETMFLIEDLDR